MFFSHKRNANFKQKARVVGESHYYNGSRQLAELRRSLLLKCLGHKLLSNRFCIPVLVCFFSLAKLYRLKYKWSTEYGNARKISFAQDVLNIYDIQTSYRFIYIFSSLFGLFELNRNLIRFYPKALNRRNLKTCIYHIILNKTFYCFLINWPLIGTW